MRLDLVRGKIDAVDRKIIHLLAERIKLSGKISGIKKEEKLKIKDGKRENEVLENVGQEAKRLNLERPWILKIFRLVISQSRKIQNKH